MDTSSVSSHRLTGHGFPMMRVAVDVLGPVDAPYPHARAEDLVGLLLRGGFIEIGCALAPIEMA